MDEAQIKDLYSSSSLPHDTTAKLVYSYLVHNCYSSTAESFGAALRIQPNQDVVMTDSSVGLGGLVGSSPEHLYFERLRKPLDTLIKRQHLMSLVLAGSVSKAKQEFINGFPHIMDNSKQVLDVLFLLSCQEFIELVSKNSDCSLEYAKVELSKFSHLEYKTEMEELVSLLAYTNPKSSPVAHYLTMGRRELVARKLNRLILSYDGWPELSPLENNVRQLVCVREQLHAEKDKKVYTFSKIRFRVQDGILVILFNNSAFEFYLRKYFFFLQRWWLRMLRYLERQNVAVP